MYNLHAYGEMIADKGRTDAYVEALRRTVSRDSVVLDIGTGTGIFALLACRFGARKVYAVETSDVIQVARETARANGFGDRTAFFQDVSVNVTLPERADVVVSDLRGLLPLYDEHIPTIIDARKRHLKPGGILIPREDVLRVAAVEAADLYRAYEEPWIRNEYGLDLSAARSLLIHTWQNGKTAADQLLSRPCSWVVLDYGTVAGPGARGEATLKVEKAGTVHGLAVWFDTTLVEGIGFSNAPDEPGHVYGRGFFPLEEPVPVRPGDTIGVFLKANLVGGNYIWNWDTSVFERGDPDRVKARFSQSTFHGVPLSLSRLRKRGADFVPVLKEDGEIDRFILSRMNGSRPLEEIARETVGRFRGRFRDWEEALPHVGELSQKYSK